MLSIVNTLDNTLEVCFWVVGIIGSQLFNNLHKLTLNSEYLLYSSYIPFSLSPRSGWMEVFNFFNISWLLNLPELSCVLLFATTWTVAWQATLSMEFSRQEYWSGVAMPSSRGSSDPGIKPMSLALTGKFFLTLAPPGKLTEPPNTD